MSISFLQNTNMSSERTYSNETTSTANNATKKSVVKNDKKQITLSKTSPEKDSKTKPTTKSTSALTTKNKKSKSLKPKQHKNDDDHFDDNDWETSDDSFSDDDDDNHTGVVLDEAAYAEFLNKIFPSEFSKAKADALKNEKSDKETSKTMTSRKPKGAQSVASVKKDTDTAIVTRSKNKPLKKSTSEQKKNISKAQKPFRHQDNHNEEDEDYVPSTELSDTDSFEDDDDELEAEIAELMSGKGQKYNIVFTFGNNETDDEDESDCESDCDDESDDDDFDGYTSDDFKRDTKLLKQFETMRKTLDEKEFANSVVLKGFDEETKYLKKSIERFKKKKEKKSKEANLKKFKKIMRESTKAFDEKKFFKQCSLKEQEDILNQLEEINKLVFIEKPYKFKLLETDMPNELKACAIKKIEMLNYMDPGMGEYYKLKSWIDTFMEIPFGKYKQMPISIDDGIDKCREFMTNAKTTLDKVAFGLDDAKMQIIQMMGMWLTNPQAIGSAIAIQGPPGTGKTTLVKEGISKILGRDFAFIALGGATDSSFLEGHSYTYEGSKWGKIVDILVQCKSMNPIIYFDELDKISDTAKGEEIVGILTHLTDTSQNTGFHDKYFSEVEFDLSKCLFIFSYNDESKINPILRDRMYRIYTQGYTASNKRSIVCDYLLPKIHDTLKFKESDVIISDDVINHIVSNYTENEKGVRNLKRCMEIIHTKLNLYRYIDSDSEFYDSQSTSSQQTASHKLEFPITLTKDLVDKLLKKSEVNNDAPISMYM